MGQINTIKLLRSYIRHWATQSEHQVAISFIPDRRMLPGHLKRSAIPGYIISITLNGRAIGEGMLAQLIVGDLHEQQGIKYHKENVKASLAGFIWDAFEAEDLPNRELDKQIVEKCITRGCLNKPHGHGLCSKHYERRARIVAKEDDETRGGAIEAK